MLTHIQIRDFAIIDAIELELGAGLTVLTGETGAGKSILVDALLFAAGGRAGAEVIRHGADKAEISATFSVAGNWTALKWLTEQAVEHDGDCLLRRVIGKDGRTRAYVNGQAMPVQALRQLGEMLVDVHGQMEYQSLVRRSAQRDLLDRSGDHAHLIDEAQAHWGELSELREARERAMTLAQDREARLDLLSFHLNELNVLDVNPTEVQELSSERLRLAQSGRLNSGTRQILALLRDDEEVSAETAVARALTVARSLAEYDARFAETAALIDQSLIGLREGIAAVERYESSLEADPGRQEWVEQRLAAIESLARKHRVDPCALDELRRSMAIELERLEASEASMKLLDKALQTAEGRFADVCRQLSAARSEAAAKLSSSITALMQRLGMPGGAFDIAVRTLEMQSATAQGADDIEFLVSANPGQPPKPLAKVASGGELSRISLAIQVAAAQRDGVPCLVFDEVDAGVGGGVAEIVGRQLRTLGERHQVLCVTHLPQVASQAHAHVRVAKLTDGKTTRTMLHALTPEERVEEIARMLGGIDVTSKARDHAAEMLGTRPSAKKKAARK